MKIAEERYEETWNSYLDLLNKDSKASLVSFLKSKSVHYHGMKQLDAMRIFLKKLDAKVYNGDYEVPIRVYFPTEEAMQAGVVEGNTFPILLSLVNFRRSAG